MSGRDQVLERRTRLTVCCWCILGFVVAGDRQDDRTRIRKMGSGGSAQYRQTWHRGAAGRSQNSGIA
jgi:hypothetical protein